MDSHPSIQTDSLNQYQYEAHTFNYPSLSPSSGEDDFSPLHPTPGYTLPASAGSSVTSFEEDLYSPHETSLHFNYNDSQLQCQPQYYPDPLQLQEPTYSQVPLHAPIPRSHRTLRPPTDSFYPEMQQRVLQHHQPMMGGQSTHTQAPMPMPMFDPLSEDPATSNSNYPQQPSLLHQYGLPQSGAQAIFPTPSELLLDVTAQDDLFVQSLPKSEPEAETKHTTQRKARQRALADSIGFKPTDPDTISSHEKKRHYLECLEQYIVYLHDQLHLVGAAPVALERVSTYRGLSSRSIRTLLVHMENTVRKMHQQTLTEEQVFLNLRNRVVIPNAQQAQDAAVAAHEFRRHSVAACMSIQGGVQQGAGDSSYLP